MKTLKERILKLYPDACHTKEQHDVTKKVMHHVFIGNDLAGYHARESWAWSQAYQWLLINKPELFNPLT